MLIHIKWNVPISYIRILKIDILIEYSLWFTISGAKVKISELPNLCTGHFQIQICCTFVAEVLWLVCFLKLFQV